MAKGRQFKVLSTKRKKITPIKPKRARKPIPVFASARKLTKALAAAFGCGPTASMEVFMARYFRKRNETDRAGSHTTCIACGGWIPVGREERRQHTCSDACQNWYRRFLRSLDAAKYCRYCHRPQTHPEAVRMRRPGRPRLEASQPQKDAQKIPGATRHTPTKTRHVGETELLVPSGPEGVPVPVDETAYGTSDGN